MRSRTMSSNKTKGKLRPNDPQFTKWGSPQHPATARPCQERQTGAPSPSNWGHQGNFGLREGVSMRNALFSIVISIIIAPTVSLADPHVVTFDRDGTAFIDCTCAAATSACASAVGDALGGKQRFKWTSTGSAKAGVSVDISELCWRRRNGDSEGQGLCCVLNNDQSDVRFYWGELSDIK
jgi:hypothetical protein